jgi:hypothetical protein
MSLIIGGPILLVAFWSRETYKPIILARRAKARGQPPPPRPPPKAALKMLLTITLVRPFAMLATEPIVAFLSLYTGFVFGVLYIFFEGYPYSFEAAYGFDLQQIGLTFIGVGVGVLLGAALFIVIDKTIYQRERERSDNHPEPEHRLYSAMIGSILVPVGIFWFSWTTYRDVHWISSVIAGAVFGCGNIGIFVSHTCPAMCSKLTITALSHDISR